MSIIVGGSKKEIFTARPRSLLVTYSFDAIGRFNMVKSILDGTDDLIDQWLGLDENAKGQPPRYKHKSNLQALSKNRPLELNGTELVPKLLEQIEANWKNREPVDRKPSSENWRFNKQLLIDPRSSSYEKTLEKAIVAVTEGDWANQVPVASGLVSSSEGKRAIDLIHLTTDNIFEFIELKIDEASGGPLHAAIEILLYGLIYAFSRQHLEELGYSTNKLLLSAKKIELQVLAPATYYKKWYLEPLENAISGGLHRLTEDCGYSLAFKFRSFPNDFEWNPWSLRLLKALEDITDVNASAGC